MNAIMLKRSGHNVHILERSSSLERVDSGAGITVGPDALNFYKTFDLTKQPYSVSCPGIQILNVKAGVRYFAKRPMEMSSWSLLYHILRANFDGYKSELCPEPPGPLVGDGNAVLDIGKRVTNVTYTERIVTVHYEDVASNEQKTLQGDLVIAADGASSSIRPLLLPDVQRAYSGYVAWRGFVLERELSEETRKLLDPRISYQFHGGGQILWSVKTEHQNFLFFSFHVRSPYSQLHHPRRRRESHSRLPLHQLGLVQRDTSRLFHVHRNHDRHSRAPAPQLPPSRKNTPLGLAGPARTGRVIFQRPHARNGAKNDKSSNLRDRRLRLSTRCILRRQALARRRRARAV